QRALANAREPGENIFVRITTERRRELGIEALGRRNVLRSLHVGHFTRYFVDQTGELVLLAWQRNDSVDLREISIGCRAGQQLEILVAPIRIAIEQPRPLPEAGPQPADLEQCLERSLLAATTDD